jgi:hypothetical protein
MRPLVVLVVLYAFCINASTQTIEGIRAAVGPSYLLQVGAENSEFYLRTNPSTDFDLYFKFHSNWVFGANMVNVNGLPRLGLSAGKLQEDNFLIAFQGNAYGVLDELMGFGVSMKAVKLFTRYAVKPFIKAEVGTNFSRMEVSATIGISYGIFIGKKKENKAFRDIRRPSRRDRSRIL